LHGSLDFRPFDKITTRESLFMELFAQNISIKRSKASLSFQKGKPKAVCEQHCASFVPAPTSVMTAFNQT
jgi:hypothetical protein